MLFRSDDLGFTGVSRTSSVLGGSRTRSVLGGSSLGGDDRAWVDRAWVKAPMGAISPVLGCNLTGVSGSMILPVLDAIRPCFWCDLLVVSLSLSLLFSWGGIHLKVKYKQKWFYRVRGHILRSTEMIFRLTQFSLCTQTPAFTKKIFPEVI